MAIVKLLLIALPISLIASTLLVIYNIVAIKLDISKNFGLGVIEYFKLFPTTSTVFTILYFVVFILGTIVVLVSLGQEWGELGMELNDFTSTYKAESEEVDYKKLNRGDFGKVSKKYQADLETFYKSLDDRHYLKERFNLAMGIREDGKIRDDLKDYMAILEELIEEIEQMEIIGPKDFKNNYLPRIERVRSMEIALNERIEGIIALKTEENRDFFIACDSEEDLKNRYRALSKAYHPDLGGHEDTFKEINKQYEEKLKSFT